MNYVSLKYSTRTENTETFQEKKRFMTIRGYLKRVYDDIIAIPHFMVLWKDTIIRHLHGVRAQNCGAVVI